MHGNDDPRQIELFDYAFSCEGERKLMRHSFESKDCWLAVNVRCTPSILRLTGKAEFDFAFLVEGGKSRIPADDTLRFFILKAT